MDILRSTLSNLLAFNVFPSLCYLWGHLPGLMKMLIELPLGLPSDSLFLWDLTLRTHILMQNNSRRKFGNKEEQHILPGAVHSVTPNQLFSITNTDLPALNESWREHWLLSPQLCSAYAAGIHSHKPPNKLTSKNTVIIYNLHIRKWRQSQV